jgi:MoaA/NifB/PqqE/SkfB family radical SAM enzyme
MHGCGEPFEHPEAPRLCAAARAAGARVAVLTSFVAPEGIERAVATLPVLDRLQIGVDAATPETYRLVRRGGDLDLVREGVRAVVRARFRLGAARPSIVLSFLLLGRNLEEAPAFVRDAYRSGADGVLFLPLDLYSIEPRAAGLIAGITPRDVARVLERAACAADRVGIPTNARLILANEMLLRHRYGGEALPGLGRCLRPWLSTYVTVGGAVRPCSRFAYDATADLGRVPAQSFASIWNGDAYRSVRRALRSGSPTLAACRSCAVPHEEGGILGNLRRRRRSP